MGGGAWPFLVGGVICLVNSVNERAKSQTSGGVIFPEGEKALAASGLSLSNRKERVVSEVRTQIYFHMVEQAWTELTSIHESITERFTFEEWRHAHALMLAARIENVKFEDLRVKPPANVRSPVPKDLRIFQPLWSVLASIGKTEDPTLGVVYLPDISLPESIDQNTEADLSAIMKCRQYNWASSWQQVLDARKRNEANAYTSRVGVSFTTDNTPVSPPDDISDIIKRIQALRSELSLSKSLYGKKDLPKGYAKEKGVVYHLTKGSKAVDDKATAIREADLIQDDLDNQMILVNEIKQKQLTPHVETHQSIDVYTVGDKNIILDPGAYGAFLRWDTQLWIGYYNIVEMLSSDALFSLSMPNETIGTYAWLLPVEGENGSRYARLPKKDIPTSTWMLGLITEMGNLPPERCSTWYVHTDRVSDSSKVRLRYLKAGIKAAFTCYAYPR